MYPTLTKPMLKEAVLGLLDEVGRIRPLRDEETDILEVLVSGGTHRVTWTKTMDEQLIQASANRGDIIDFADSWDLTAMACYKRLQKLKAKVS